MIIEDHFLLFGSGFRMIEAEHGLGGVLGDFLEGDFLGRLALLGDPRKPTLNLGRFPLFPVTELLVAELKPDDGCECELGTGTELVWLEPGRLVSLKLVLWLTDGPAELDEFAPDLILGLTVLAEKPQLDSHRGAVMFDDG